MTYGCVNGRMTIFLMTYQQFQEVMSPGLIIALFGRRSGERLTLFTQVHDEELVNVGHVGIGCV